MFGFRKKITVRQFWGPRLEGMFSGKNEPGWDYLKQSFEDPALSAVESKVFYAHVQAMTIEIVSIAITKSCSMDTSTASRVFVGKFLRDNHHEDVSRLEGQYNSAFGSSATDGIRKVVEYFSASVSDSTLKSETINGIYSTLYQLLASIFSMLKEIKLTP